MRTVRALRDILGAACLCLMATTAAAQGYDFAEVSGQLEERPADAEALDLRYDDADKAATSVALPFPFWFYGERKGRLTVSAYGWVRPRAAGAPAEPTDTAAPFPLGPGRSRSGGAIAPYCISKGEGAPGSGRSEDVSVHTWTLGEAPRRRFVVSWRSEAGTAQPARTTQLHLHESTDRIVFAYAQDTMTGTMQPETYVSGLWEPGGRRRVLSIPAVGSSARPPTDAIFTPRTVLANPPDIGKEGAPPEWKDVRKESTVPDGCTKRCTYLAGGGFYFSVPDRGAWYHDPKHGPRKRPREHVARIQAEDLRTFGGKKHDTPRWVRQVLDGKILLAPADGGEPLRVWFRIIEYFTIDDRGATRLDHHVWNLRWMLSNAFPGTDPREQVDRYYAWKAMATSRLTVGKLFATDQTDDAGKQFDTGRKNEYLLWAGRLKHGIRGALPSYATPGDGWARFHLEEDDANLVQYADKASLRFVADPNYVDGHYAYTITAPDNPFGWVTGRGVPRPPLRDEGFDTDPGRTSGPETPR